MPCDVLELTLGVCAGVPIRSELAPEDELDCASPMDDGDALGPVADGIRTPELEPDDVV
jgi:hypothetical protein